MFYTFTMLLALMFNVGVSSLPEAPVDDRLPKTEEGKPAPIGKDLPRLPPIRQ